MKSTVSLISIICLLLISIATISGKRSVVIYWGQDGAGIEPSLATVCQNDKVGIVVLAFVDIFFNANDGNLPCLNLANHCSTTFPGHQLLHCPQVAADIKTCQSLGVNVTISLGGAAGSYGFTSKSQAQTFATTIYNTFLGGSSSLRPFDTAILEGVDLDIEGGSPNYYSDFITSLRGLQGGIIVSGAPQCPYPDAYLGPTIQAVGNDFTYLYIQFYNNYCGALTTSFNFNQWISGTTSNIILFVGLPAAQGAAGSGYVPLSQLSGVVKPLFTNNRFGGVMLWDAGYNQQTSYSEGAEQILNS